MLNRSASLAMSTSVLKALPGKLDIKRHSPSILYFLGKCINEDIIKKCRIIQSSIHSRQWADSCPLFHVNSDDFTKINNFIVLISFSYAGRSGI